MNNGFKRSPETSSAERPCQRDHNTAPKPTLRLSTFILGPQFKKSLDVPFFKKPLDIFIVAKNQVPLIRDLLLSIRSLTYVYLPDPGGASVQLGQSPCYGAASAQALSQSDVMQHQRLLEIAQDLIFGRGMSLSSAFPPIFFALLLVAFRGVLFLPLFFTFGGWHVFPLPQLRAWSTGRTCQRICYTES